MSMTTIRTSRHFNPAIRVDRPGTAAAPAAIRPAGSASSGTDIADDLDETADLYFRRPPQSLTYRHFDSAAVAIRYVRDNLNSKQIVQAILEVGERRFEGEALLRMVNRLAPALAKA